MRRAGPVAIIGGGGDIVFGCCDKAGTCVNIALQFFLERCLRGKRDFMHKFPSVIAMESNVAR